MADGTDAPPPPSPSGGGLQDQEPVEVIELSEAGRALIEETADLVVDLPD